MFTTEWQKHANMNKTHANNNYAHNYVKTSFVHGWMRWLKEGLLHFSIKFFLNKRWNLNKQIISFFL